MATGRLICRPAGQQQGGFRAGGDEIIHVGKCFLSPSPDIFWASVPPYLGKGLGTGAACPRCSQAGPVVPWAPRDMGGVPSLLLPHRWGLRLFLEETRCLALMSPTPALPLWPGSGESSVGKDELWAWK